MVAHFGPLWRQKFLTPPNNGWPTNSSQGLLEFLPLVWMEMSRRPWENRIEYRQWRGAHRWLLVMWLGIWGGILGGHWARILKSLRWCGSWIPFLSFAPSRFLTLLSSGLFGKVTVLGIPFQPYPSPTSVAFSDWDCLSKGSHYVSLSLGFPTI